MEGIERKYGEVVAVIGVHCGKFTAEHDLALIADTLRQYRIRHPVVNDPDYRLWQEFGTRAWPTLFVVDPLGQVVGRIEGEVEFEFLDQLVAAMVEEWRQHGQLQPRPLPLAPTAEVVAGQEPWLDSPQGLAVDEAGRLWIADTGHHRLVVVDEAGREQATVGSGEPGLVDGPLEAAAFRAPRGLAAADGKIYVADSGNHAVRMVDWRAGTVKTLAGTGSKGGRLAPGPARDLALRSPWGLAWYQGRLLVAMAGAHQIWEIEVGGEGRARVLAGTGAEDLFDGGFASARFAQPFGLAPADDRVFVADSESSAIRVLDFRRRRVETLAGRGLFVWGDRDGPAEEALLQHPAGVAWDGGGLWIADTYNHKVKRWQAGHNRIETVAGFAVPGGPPGLREPTAVAVTADRLYVADTGNHRIWVRPIPEGVARVLVPGRLQA